MTESLVSKFNCFRDNRFTFDNRIIHSLPATIICVHNTVSRANCRLSLWLVVHRLHAQYKTRNAKRSVLHANQSVRLKYHRMQTGSSACTRRKCWAHSRIRGCLAKWVEDIRGSLDIKPTEQNTKTTAEQQPAISNSVLCYTGSRTFVTNGRSTVCVCIVSMWCVLSFCLSFRFFISTHPISSILSVCCVFASCFCINFLFCMFTAWLKWWQLLFMFICRSQNIFILHATIYNAFISIHNISSMYIHTIHE